MAIANHVNISVSVQGASPQSAGFGTPMFVYEHSVTANRQDGPYTSLAGLVADGFISSTAAYQWAAEVFSQDPRPSQVMIGRIDAADVTLTESLDAIEADDPSSWYCTNIGTRTGNDIMALANWTESRRKIAICQSADADILTGTASSTAQTSTVTVGGTATDGDYTITIYDDWTGAEISSFTVTRATTPATNDDLATALEAGLDTDTSDSVATMSAAASVITIVFQDPGHSYTIVTSAPAPGTLVAANTATANPNPAIELELGAFDRTALIYHSTDADYVDGAFTGRGLAAALDQPDGQITWAYKTLSGVTADSLAPDEVAELLDVNCNYNAPVRASSGVESNAFTFPGKMASGRFIDNQVSVDWLHARMEEAMLGVLLGTTTKIPYTDAGIAQFHAAALGVLELGVRCAHFAKAESSSSGRMTPYIDAPLVADVSTLDKQARRLSLSGEAVFAGAIHSVGDADTVGFTIDLGF